MQEKHFRGRHCSFYQRANKQIHTARKRWLRTLYWTGSSETQEGKSQWHPLEKGWLGWVEDSRGLQSRVYFKTAAHKKMLRNFLHWRPKYPLTDEDYFLLENCLFLALGVKILFDRLKLLDAVFCWGALGYFSGAFFFPQGNLLGGVPRTILVSKKEVQGP